MGLKKKMFNRLLEKPITDITIVTYELYHNSQRVYLDESNCINYEDFCKLIKEKLEELYKGGKN